MTVLRDSIHIRVLPEDIFEWFRNLDKNYRSWHQDHIKWEFQGGFREGGACYGEELIHERLHKMTGRIARLKKDRLVEFRFSLPTSLICPRGSFIIEPCENGSTFTATLTFRFGWMLSVLAKRRANAVRSHMKEEGENLKRILEQQRGVY